MPTSPPPLGCVPGPGTNAPGGNPGGGPGGGGPGGGGGCKKNMGGVISGTCDTSIPPGARSPSLEAPPPPEGPVPPLPPNPAMAETRASDMGADPRVAAPASPWFAAAPARPHLKSGPSTTNSTSEEMQLHGCCVRRVNRCLKQWERLRRSSDVQRLRRRVPARTAGLRELRCNAPRARAQDPPGRSCPVGRHGACFVAGRMGGHDVRTFCLFQAVWVEPAALLEALHVGGNDAGHLGLCPLVGELPSVEGPLEPLRWNPSASSGTAEAVVRREPGHKGSVRREPGHYVRTTNNASCLARGYGSKPARR